MRKASRVPPVQYVVATPLVLVLYVLALLACDSRTPSFIQAERDLYPNNSQLNPPRDAAASTAPAAAVDGSGLDIPTISVPGVAALPSPRDVAGGAAPAGGTD